jgi:hypothetical protein
MVSGGTALTFLASTINRCRYSAWPPLWSSGQSYWLHNGDVLCFLCGTNCFYTCYVEESRPPLWSSGQRSWLLNGDILSFHSLTQMCKFQILKRRFSCEYRLSHYGFRRYLNFTCCDYPRITSQLHPEAESAFGGVQGHVMSTQVFLPLYQRVDTEVVNRDKYPVLFTTKGVVVRLAILSLFTQKRTRFSCWGVKFAHSSSVHFTHSLERSPPSEANSLTQEIPLRDTR